MKQRIITGAVLVIALIAILALGTPFVELAVILLAAVGVIELLNAVRLSDKKILLITGIFGSVWLVGVQCFDGQFFGPSIFAFLLVVFAVYMINMKTIEFKDVASLFFITVYVSFMFAHVILLRNTQYGYLMIWLALIGAYVTDTAALFGGKFFGKHKLCPVLSPKKTVEGSISGVVGSVVGTLVLCLVAKLFFALNGNLVNALIIAVTMSVVAQLGDLSASCIKRQFGIKDYGKLFPGHGGVMDRFDSLLFAAPFVYYMLMFLPIF